MLSLMKINQKKNLKKFFCKKLYKMRGGHLCFGEKSPAMTFF
jgi:hypothetical protein